MWLLKLDGLDDVKTAGIDVIDTNKIQNSIQKVWRCDSEFKISK